jgi:tRNA(Ile)-lysidine synthase
LIFENVQESKNQCKNSIYIDKDLVEFPLKLRKWEVGDYIYPIGMKGKKKISKYFKDEKFSLLEKENTWLLCNTKNEVIWIVSHRQDRRFVGNQNLKVTLNS